MNTQRVYGGLIWTNHALLMLSQRKLSQDVVLQTFFHPDTTGKGNTLGSSKYTKQFGAQTVTVIAKKNKEGEWIVVSNWIDPPYSGTKDAKEKKAYWTYQKAPEWKKWLVSLWKAIGG